MTGWQAACIGNVCQVIAGQSPDGKFYNAEAKGMPFYQGKKEFGERYINSPTTWTTNVTKEAEAGDILMSVRAPVGAINVSTDRVCIGRGLAAIRPSDRLSRDFLYYFLKYAEPSITGTEGAVFPSINKKQIEAIELPVPPLPEQQRIVGILDQAFEGIAKAKANAERNLVNAKELFANAFDDLLAQRCQDAPMASLASIADFKNGLNFNRSSKGQVIKIVGVADFKNNFWTPDELDEVQIEGSLSEAYELRDDDILVVRSNGNKELIGRCILARGVEGKTSHSGFTIRVRPHSDSVDSEYLTHFMKSSAVRKALVASGDGANISSLNQKALSSVMVPLPPVSVQREIVNDLTVLGEKIGQMTLIMGQKSSAIDELRQSVLHQAFSGNL